MTSPSPIILGPTSSAGFLRASRAASASASCRFSFSKALMRKIDPHKYIRNRLMYYIYRHLINTNIKIADTNYQTVK